MEMIRLAQFDWEAFGDPRDLYRHDSARAAPSQPKARGRWSGHRQGTHVPFWLFWGFLPMSTNAWAFSGRKHHMNNDGLDLPLSRGEEAGYSPSRLPKQRGTMTHSIQQDLFDIAESRNTTREFHECGYAAVETGGESGFIALRAPIVFTRT